MIDFDNDSFQLNPKYRLQYEEAQQAHVLLYPEGLVKLSATAAEILGCCTTATSATALIGELQQAYPEADSLAGDVREFLHEADAQGWIVKTEA